MKQELRYRHELKYEITFLEYIVLQRRLKLLMLPDGHVKPDGTYKICSLYWDNFQDKALHEKICGLTVREKFRIRYYNDDPSFLKLEKKSKVNRLYLKETCPITVDDCRKLLDGNYTWMLDSPNALIHEFYLKIMHQQLRPKTCVIYEREPFTYPAGNVRVTFDRKIQSGMYQTDFLSPNLTKLPAPIQKDIILEIKYDDFLPEMIQDIIQTGASRAQAFSKYAACRQYEY